MRGSAVFAVLGLACAHGASFNVAYVEHQATSPCGSGSCGAATKAANVKALAAYAAQAAAKGAQVIVFPEYAITGFSSYAASAWHSGGYSEAVPPPPAPGAAARTVPCSSPGGVFASSPTLVALSCAAQRSKIALVANLAEWADGKYLFNTDVAFDTDGAFVARYRKQNLWGEAEMSVPQTCPQVAFNTSFGVTFGLLTCADLIYAQPALALLAAGTRHFLMPAAWTNVDAQMQANAFAQGWSARAGAGTSLVVANHRGTDSSGSGVWAAGRTLSFQYDTRAAEGQVQVVGAVVAVDDGADAGTAAWEQQQQQQSQQRVLAPITLIPSGNSSSSSSSSSSSNNSSSSNGGGSGGDRRRKRSMLEASLAAALVAADDDEAGTPTWTFAKLEDGAKLCSSDGAQCCTASLPSGSGGPGSPGGPGGVGAAAAAAAAVAGYALALADGTDTEVGNVWGAHACAVLPCESPGKSCLSYQTPGPVVGRHAAAAAAAAAAVLASVSIELCGLEVTDFVVPEVVAGSAAHEQIMLAPGAAGSPGAFAFGQKAGCWQLSASAAAGEHITSAVIYGRRFSEDKLPYTCPKKRA